MKSQKTTGQSNVSEHHQHPISKSVPNQTLNQIHFNADGFETPKNSKPLLKLWYSYQKEMLLSSKSWYFMIELGMAIIILLILLFVMPENFNTRGEEYFYLDLPEVVKEQLIKKTLKDDLDGVVAEESLKVKDQSYTVQVVETKDKDLIYLPTEAALLDVVDRLAKTGIVLKLGADNTLQYTYHLQGYETEKLKNLLLMVHSDAIPLNEIESAISGQKTAVLNPEGIKLSDRENFLPVFLTLNGSFMSLFVIAAYIFLDRQEGIIKAYAVTASPLSNYLISKSGVVVTTSVLSSLITLMPIMLLKINYGLVLLVLIPSAFFAAFLGLIVTSFYRNISQAFGALFATIILMMLPTISYMLPSWEPTWIRLLPTFYLVQSFKEILMGFGNENIAYVAWTSLGFALGCIPLYAMAKRRFDKTLTL